MKKTYLIGNAHIDPVWLWRWQEGFSEIRATFRSALDRMNDYPDFRFTSACAVYYEWIEKVDPEMFAEIRQRVKEGRWNIRRRLVLTAGLQYPVRREPRETFAYLSALFQGEVRNYSENRI